MEKNDRLRKRKEKEIPQDLDFIAPLFLKEIRHGEIATQLQALREYRVTTESVYHDIRKLLVIWKDDRANLITSVLEIHLRKLENMERIAWEQFEKSKQSKIKTVQKERSVFDKKKNKALDNLTNRQHERHVIEGIGDVQWFDRAMQCVKMQAEILGFKNIAVTIPTEAVAPIGDLVFLTRTRKKNSQFTEAVEVPEEDQDGTGIQKLLQS